MTPGTLARFKQKIAVDRETGCWNWTAHRIYSGYGVFRHGAVVRFAHRVAFEHWRGAVPAGLELDHRCRNRHCCNPDHLEPVTHRDNMLRGSQATATTCKNGHLFDEANTYSHQGRRYGPRRTCRACNADSARRYRLSHSH